MSSSLILIKSSQHFKHASMFSLPDSFLRESVTWRRSRVYREGKKGDDHNAVQLAQLNVRYLRHCSRSESGLQNDRVECGN